MPTHRRFHGSRHLASLQCIGSLFKVGNHHAFAKLTQCTALLCRALVITLFFRQRSKTLCQLLLRYSLQHTIDAVNPHFGSRLLLSRRILTHQHQNVTCRKKVLPLKTRRRLVIRPSSLTLNVVIVHKGRKHHLLLVAIQFLANGAQRVNPLAFSLSHFQFEIDKQRHIFLHRLLVEHTIRIIFVKRILKFTSRNVLSIDFHHDRVARLCYSREDNHQRSH